MKLIKLFVLFVAISFVVGVGSAFDGQNKSSTEFVDKSDVESNSTQVELVETPLETDESTKVVDKDEKDNSSSVNNNSFNQSKSENVQSTKENSSSKGQQSVDKSQVRENVSTEQNNEDKVGENNSQNEVVEENTIQLEEEKEKELTIWEELGITEYEYYNSPMFKWQTVTHSDFDSCNLAGIEATKVKTDETTGEQYQDYTDYWCYGVNSYSGRFLGTMLKLS